MTSDIQTIGKDNMDAATMTFGAMSKNMQIIATEVGDYYKAAYEDGLAHLQNLMGARSFEKVIELQSTYLKTAYDRFSTQTTKVNELVASAAGDAKKPYEKLIPRTKVSSALSG